MGALLRPTPIGPGRLALDFLAFDWLPSPLRLHPPLTVGQCSSTNQGLFQTNWSVFFPESVTTLFLSIFASLSLILFFIFFLALFSFTHSSLLFSSFTIHILSSLLFRGQSSIALIKLSFLCIPIPIYCPWTTTAHDSAFTYSEDCPLAVLGMFGSG